MVFCSGDFEYVGGNLAADPRLGRFVADDGMYDEVVWMTVALNHEGGATEYVELEARGMVREYVKNLVASGFDPLAKGTFVMAGGAPAGVWRGRRRLRVVVFSASTSVQYRALDWGRLHATSGQAS